jgi:UDP-glucose 4-epimerase
MKTKVIVIGGSGFLGSHLADRLSDCGYQVVIYDQVASPWLRPDQEMVIGGIMDPAALDAAFAGASYVYHLAGLADIGEASRRPRDTIALNVMGSVEVIEACLRHKVEKLLFASTIYVYSDKGSFYRVSKQAVELLLENYGKEYGLTHTILRYGSLYGPRAQEWNGLKGFVTQAITQGRIVYPGTGQERREYIHVADAARMSVDALAPEFNNACLTLTGSQVMTTREMLEMIGEILGRDVTLTFATGESEYRLHHYQATPYRYLPKLGRKIVPNTFIDLGQGILEIIDEIHGEHDAADNAGQN